MKNVCLNHPEQKALSICHHCGVSYCANCLNEGKMYYYCNKQECYEKYLQEGPSDIIKRESDSKLKILFKTLIVLIAITIGIVLLFNLRIIKRYFVPPKPTIIHHLGIATNYTINVMISNKGGEGIIICEAKINCGRESWTQSVKKFFRANSIDVIDLRIDSSRCFFGNYEIKVYPE